MNFLYENHKNYGHLKTITSYKFMFLRSEIGERYVEMIYIQI